jgi:7,8-dihydropterin-6-yl-methyl-4-(beta-D-ribofuranosyl)aminobenzene 5'-phosphate synthase
MKKTVIFLIISLLLLTGAVLSAQEGQNIKFTIIYDNTVHKKELKPDWGFACLVESEEKNILFDTGTKPEILIENMEKLKIGFNLPEIVIISHNHPDHTGGLLEYLSKNSHVPVYLPASSPDDFINLINGKSAGVILKPDPYEVCRGVYLTGEMGTTIKEQSMVFDLGDKIVVMTGCAHPGIVNIVRRAKEIVNKDIYLVFGGFHLMNYNEAQINNVIGEFRKMGVQKCGATHCTGEMQIEMFRKAFGKDFLELGAGQVLNFKDGDLINPIQ